MLMGFMDKLKYIPYKIGEPKRLMALGLGVLGMAAGYSLKPEGKEGAWKMFLLVFGATAIAAFVAGVLNPVTLYNRSRYGSTTQFTGLTEGQGDTEFMPAGASVNYGAFGPIIPAPATMAPTPRGAVPTSLFRPAYSPNDPIQLGRANIGTQYYGSTTQFTGLTEGQGDTEFMPAGASVNYGADLPQPGRPPFYYGASVPTGGVLGCNPMTGEGCNEVPPTEGDIYIRDVGEVEFNGGI
jgi:hypothetical protein